MRFEGKGLPSCSSCDLRSCGSKTTRYRKCSRVGSQLVWVVGKAISRVVKEFTLGTEEEEQFTECTAGVQWAGHCLKHSLHCRAMGRVGLYSGEVLSLESLCMQSPDM